MAVGAIDDTSHRIYRPEVEPQELYNLGHRQFHCLHTQVVSDAYGTIRYKDLNDAKIWINATARN